MFDKAHIINIVCIKAFLVTLQSQHLEQAIRLLDGLFGEINHVKAADGMHLHAKYQNLVLRPVDHGC